MRSKRVPRSARAERWGAVRGSSRSARSESAARMSTLGRPSPTAPRACADGSRPKSSKSTTSARLAAVSAATFRMRPRPSPEPSLMRARPSRSGLPRAFAKAGPLRSRSGEEGGARGDRQEHDAGRMQHVGREHLHRAPPASARVPGRRVELRIVGHGPELDRRVKTHDDAEHQRPTAPWRPGQRRVKAPSERDESVGGHPERQPIDDRRRRRWPRRAGRSRLRSALRPPTRSGGPARRGPARLPGACGRPGPRATSRTPPRAAGAVPECARVPPRRPAPHPHREPIREPCRERRGCAGPGCP